MRLWWRLHVALHSIEYCAVRVNEVGKCRTVGVSITDFGQSVSGTPVTAEWHNAELQRI